MTETLESSVMEEEDEGGILNEVPDQEETVDVSILHNQEIDMTEEDIDDSD